MGIVISLPLQLQWQSTKSSEDVMLAGLFSFHFAIYFFAFMFNFFNNCVNTFLYYFLLILTVILLQVQLTLGQNMKVLEKYQPLNKPKKNNMFFFPFYFNIKVEQAILIVTQHLLQNN